MRGYEKGKNGPLKVKFKSQTASETVLSRPCKLKEKKVLKHVHIRRNVREEERVNIKQKGKMRKDQGFFFFMKSKV